MGRGREGPQKFLGQWEGILQTDGCQAYDGIGGPKLVHVGCWAHARRRTVDAVKVNRYDATVIKMVMRMDALFLVDRDARKEMTAEERLVTARQQHGEVWAEEIRHECIKLSGTVLPKSATGKAVSYTLNMWPKLRRCFDCRKWNCPTTWPKIRCDRWRWAVRTGYMSAAPKPDRKSPRSCRLSNPAVGLVSR